MAMDPHDLTSAGIWELCATSQDLVDDMHLAIESSHTLCRTAADLRRQSRQAREARATAAARRGHKAFPWNDVLGDVRKLPKAD